MCVLQFFFFFKHLYEGPHTCFGPCSTARKSIFWTCRTWCRDQSINKSLLLDFQTPLKDKSLYYCTLLKMRQYSPVSKVSTFVRTLKVFFDFANCYF